MKREFKGSPWPWEMKGLSVYSADGNEVMTAYDRDDRVLLAVDLDTTDANLYLTAAAPELLDALQDLVDFFDPNSQVGYMATQKCIDKAKKVIEKALGAQSVGVCV